jgi:MraZ protein
MQNLVGEYRHKLDTKGRLSLPSAFRKALSKDLIVTLSPDGACLYAFEAEGFGEWVGSLFAHDGGFDSGNKAHVRARKVLNSRAKSVEIDGSGRIGIPAQQRQDAVLEKDVVLIGDADHFEIWDAKRWDEFSSSVDLESIFTN